MYQVKMKIEADGSVTVGLSDLANRVLGYPDQVVLPTVGTKLIREYQGVEHHVTVTRNGFEYQGRTFRSLSHIARDITGTRKKVLEFAARVHDGRLKPPKGAIGETAR